jgi:hypothetical protein
MKRHLSFAILFVLTSLTAKLSGQDGKYQQPNFSVTTQAESSDEFFVSTLNAIDCLIQARTAELSLKVFCRNSLTDEVDSAYSGLLFAISELKKKPKQKVYWNGSYINPIIIQQSEIENGWTLVVEHGETGNRKQRTFEVTLKHLK